MSKYTKEEREIVRQIEQIREQNMRYRRMYIDNEVKMASLIKKLDGKYIAKGNLRRWNNANKSLKPTM